MKTFVKWPGNKTRYLKYIIPCIPEFIGKYIEPFAGSGALLLRLQPKEWVINDLNNDLINIYKCVRDSPEEIIEIFKEFGSEFVPMNTDAKLSFCRLVTSLIENLDYDINRASFYMLMKYCVYMGNIIVKNELYFMGLDLHITIQDKYFFLRDNCYSNIRNVSKFLKTGKIHNKDYKEILNEAKEGDFIFMDPPYIERHDYSFNYNKGEVLANF
jgi:DNA adenine methylase